ncbi:cytochrome P450 3A40-like [Diadema antillarum]|uniref:cytochrome P450 3A40-like n=1 Tax=Diadema antillarum TaxID=105358 RepID=UPI003A8AA98B
MTYFEWSWSGPTWNLVIAVILLAFMYMVWCYTFFLRRNIPGPVPLPIFGNALEWRKGIHLALDDYIQKYGSGCGFYKFFYPSILVSDPETIKQIMVKHFDRFSNREPIPLDNPNMDKALFLSSDDLWRKIRHTLTPAFSGRKMKLMSLMVNEPADRLLQNFKTIYEKSNGVFECRELYGAYVIDTIALCAFGLHVDSQRNKNHPFVTNAKRFFASLDFTSPAMILSTIIPGAGKILKWLGLSVFPEDVIAFFKAVVDEAVDNRKSTNDKTRLDFLQLMIDAAEEDDGDDDGDGGEDLGSRSTNRSTTESKTKREPLTRQELTSQALAFFFAGYETTSSAISFASYLLATHPEEQDRLIDEIDRLAPSRDDVTYETMKSLTFLDNVINEALRLYPPGAIFDRICARTTVIGDRVFPAGASVTFNVWSTHRDPEFWPNPEKFDPDRFSKENRAKRHPFAHLPFGGGPRVCIGLRFAVMEIKTALVRVLQEFRLEVTSATEIPPEFGKMGFIFPPKGITLRVVPREDDRT